VAFTPGAIKMELISTKIGRPTSNCILNMDNFIIIILVIKILLTDSEVLKVVENVSKTFSKENEELKKKSDSQA
jgi:hypothetical protein